IQALPGPAAFYRVLMRYAPNQVFPDIVHLRCSGEPLEPELVAQMGAAFPNAQRTQAYGATDAGWRIAVPLPMTDPRVTQGAVGAPLPFFETRLQPLPDLPSGQGELYVRGPAVCLGYLSESGSHEGLTSDGWFSTRDIAELGTDGCLYIRGRVDVLFKSGGRWVNPVEVERLLGRLPGVAAARCFPKPHPLLGKAPVAEVVVNAGHALTPEALRDACLGQLEDHQLPREFHMVPEVSVGASGKKLRS
ncbi:MAG TPA: fatty acid--CoA ligase family protein, partial [bacterium]